MLASCRLHRWPAVTAARVFQTGMHPRAGKLDEHLIRPGQVEARVMSGKMRRPIWKGMGAFWYDAGTRIRRSGNAGLLSRDDGPGFAARHPGYVLVSATCRGRQIAVWVISATALAPSATTIASNATIAWPLLTALDVMR